MLHGESVKWNILPQEKIFEEIMCHIEAATYLLWGILEGQNRLNTKT